MVITVGEIYYQACGNLLHSVQTGSPAFDTVFGASLFDYLQQNVDVADAFNKGMTNVFSMLAYVVLMAYDFRNLFDRRRRRRPRQAPREASSIHSGHHRYGFRYSVDDRKSKARPWQRCIEQALLIRYRRLLRFGSTRSGHLPSVWGDS